MSDLTTDPRKEEQIQSILHDLMEYINAVQNTLRQLEVPENLIQQETLLLPDFDKMLPDDVEVVFQRIRFLTINYYYTHGFSQREISRRLGGTSVLSVNKYIKENYDRRTDRKTK
jgi:hypothetical protein